MMFAPHEDLVDDVVVPSISAEQMMFNHHQMMNIFAPQEEVQDEVALVPSLSAADIAKEFAHKEKSRNFPYVLCQIWMNTVLRLTPF